MHSKQKYLSQGGGHFLWWYICCAFIPHLCISPSAEKNLLLIRVLTCNKTHYSGLKQQQSETVRE